MKSKVKNRGLSLYILWVSIGCLFLSICMFSGPLIHSIKNDTSSLPVVRTPTLYFYYMEAKSPYNRLLPEIRDINETLHRIGNVSSLDPLFPAILLFDNEEEVVDKWECRSAVGVAFQSFDHDIHSLLMQRRTRLKFQVLPMTDAVKTETQNANHYFNINTHKYSFQEKDYSLHSEVIKKIDYEFAHLLSEHLYMDISVPVVELFNPFNSTVIVYYPVGSNRKAFSISSFPLPKYNMLKLKQISLLKQLKKPQN